MRWRRRTGQPSGSAALPGAGWPPERVLALTDAVVAIAMTLLVLDLNAVDYPGSSPAALWRAITAEGDRFIAFFIAFWVIAQFWLAHHRVFGRITRVEEGLASRNFAFLFGISVLPFTTRLLGEGHDNPLPVTLFSANLLLAALALNLVTARAERIGAAEPLVDEQQLRRTQLRVATMMVLFVLPGVLAWVVPQGNATLLFLLLFLADVPGRVWARRARA